MGSKTPYGLTSIGQRSTSYSPGMLSGFTNRYNSIGDAGGIMAQDTGKPEPEGIPVVKALQPTGLAAANLAPTYGSYQNQFEGADPNFRMLGVDDYGEGQSAYDAIVAASAAIDTPGEFTKVLNDAYAAEAGVDTAYQERSTAWAAENEAKAELYRAEQDGTDAEIASARSVLVSAQNNVETANQALSNAQTQLTSSYGVVEANVPKSFARDYATQTNQAGLPYTRTILDNVADASLEGLGSLLGGVYRGAHAVGSNLPVVGGYVGDAIEGAGEWFQTSPGVIAGSPSGVQGHWGTIPPWMQTSQVNVLGQIPGSVTNVGTMTGTVLDTLNAVRNGQITLAEAVEKDAAGIAGAMGVSVAVLQTAVFAGKTLQDIATDRDAAAVALAADENEGGTTVGGVTLDGNIATEIIEGNTAAKAAAKLLADQKAALAKATKVFDDAGGGAAGTAAVLKALEDNNLTVKDLADQTGLSLAELNTFIGANTTAGTDTTTTGTGTDTTTTGTGTDITTTGTGTDITTTGTGTDTTTTGTGTDTTTTGTGTDITTTGTGADTLIGGNGTDTLTAAADAAGATEIIVGGTEALTAAADAAGATEITAGGTDALTAAANTLGATEITVGGTDTVVAGGGTDTLTAAANTLGATDIIVGGTDTVVAGGGTDTLTAAANTLGATDITVGGTDTVVAGGGTDTLTAAADAAGATEITVGGTDTVVAGGGTDTLTAADTLGATEITVGGTEALTAADADTGATEIIVGGTEVLTAAGEDELKKITLSEAPALAAGEDELKKITLSEAPALTAGADELTEISLNETPALTAGEDEVPGLTEVLAFPDTPEQIISQGGMESVSTEKAGLAKINALYNPALSLEENLALLRRAEEEEEEEEEDSVSRALYYGGGRVQSSNIVDRISSILGGY